MLVVIVVVVIAVVATHRFPIGVEDGCSYHCCYLGLVVIVDGCRCCSLLLLLVIVVSALPAMAIRIQHLETSVFTRA